MPDIVSSRLIAGLVVLLSLMATGHILLTKDDVRAAIGWTAVVWLVPGIGAVLYLLLGINRVRRGAERRLRETFGTAEEPRYASRGPDLDALDPDADPHFVAQARLSDALTRMPLVPGNRFCVLVNGDEAYPAMLRAIEAAERTICLSTYIYDWDAVGRCFTEALARAVARGVAVRVLVDAMGSLGVAWRLRRRGIPARSFNPPDLRTAALLNLRTHRKILVIDGRLGFSGGMNIRDIHRAAGETPLASRDIMFEIRGPVVEQLVRVFAEDWVFAGGERLAGPDWYPGPAPEDGGAVARTVPDGPEGKVSNVSWILDCAISLARRRILVATPYFLPDTGLSGSLAQAALRGVAVDILVPARSNYLVVDWAAQALFPQLLDYGCRFYLTPPPFDHVKIMTIDDYWSLIGSSNLDTRSLRLNFELNVEVYDAAFARRLGALLEERIAGARMLDPAKVAGESLARRLRNRAAWLMSPYL